MKKNFLNKFGIIFFCVCLIMIFLSNFYVIANIIENEENQSSVNENCNITITVDEDGNAIMVTKDINDYLINPYKGFCVDDNPVLKEGNILSSTIDYDNYWNERNGSLATEGYARFNWYQFYDNTFSKPDNTRDYNDTAYNWDVLKDFIIVCAKNEVEARFGVMTANTTGTDSAYGKTDSYSLSKLQEHVMPAGSIMPDGTIVKEGETVYKARNATPMWLFEGIPVSYNDTNKEYIYDIDNDVEYYLDNKELQWVPKWDDKNLIKNIDDFVYSLSEYLKNEEYEGKKLIDYISFIEVRSYGNYGENHLTGINNNAKFICGALDLSKYPNYTYVEPVDCYVTNDNGETYNVFESTLYNNKIRYSLNISAEYFYDNYLTTYLNAFRDTDVTLVMNWAANWDSTYDSTEGFKPNGRLRKWVEDNNGYLTIRSDSVFAQSFGEGTQLYVCNEVAPSAFEYIFNTYKKKFENDNEAIKNNITKDLIQVIRNGRVTYMDLSNDLYSYYIDNFDEPESEFASFGNTLGYYFRLKQAKYNTNIIVDKENNLNIDLFFVNEGVSRLYDKGDSKVYVALLQTDSNGNVLYDEFNNAKIVKKYLTNINPTEWNSNFVSANEVLDASNPDNWIKESLNITVEDITSGNYMLAVGLFTNYNNDGPSIKLGNTGSTLDNWYMLGMVKVAELSIPFIDIKETDWCYEAVKFVYQNGYIVGTTEKTYEPGSKLTRGMIVTILNRIEGYNIVDGKMKFEDVNFNMYYYDSVKWAASVGIIHGYEDGLFRPDQYITREELAVILRNYTIYKGINTNLVADLSNFNDGDTVSSFAQEAVEWAVARGVITGYTHNNTIAPQGTATRDVAASVIYKYFETAPSN